MSVTVTYTPLVGDRCGVLEEDGGCSKQATLTSCSFDRRHCEWTVELPDLPGIYTANARGTDHAQNTEDPGPTIRIFVVSTIL